jgi:heavy metal sensor kinase
LRSKVDLRRLSRGLRFRLTASYALFFTLILIAVAALFWQRLESVLEKRLHETLEDHWATTKGYMRIERDPDTNKTSAFWYYDAEDPDETTIVLNLKKIHLITDQFGAVIPEPDSNGDAISTLYKDEIGADSPAEIQARVRESVASKTPKTYWTERVSKDGSRYLIRSGVVYNEAHTAPYYVAIGEPLEQSALILKEFTWVYVAIIPAALVLGSFLGWFMVGRALTPVRSVAQAAQRISGSNLNLRIPTRQADDELDYLILTFNRMIARLEASFIQMKQFSTDASHELRTPITAIRGQLEVALFTAKTTEQYREAMFNALQDIDRLSQIVRALLLLSQAESGQLVLQKARLNLCEVAGDLVDQFQIPAEEGGVHLTADLPAECFAEADRVQIERLITNLLSNAIKFTPRGGNVRLALRNAESRVEIDVEDTGRGIPTEHLPHIFDRFYRVPGSRGAPGPEEGLGLGLSFVSWIVKAHNGSVDVSSTPGKGTRFRIKLPAEPAGASTREQVPQPVA